MCILLDGQGLVEHIYLGLQLLPLNTGLLRYAILADLHHIIVFLGVQEPLLVDSALLTHGLQALPEASTDLLLSCQEFNSLLKLCLGLYSQVIRLRVALCQRLMVYFELLLLGQYFVVLYFA